jgi:uncharacterized protein YlxW (UPF0749 family)
MHHGAPTPAATGGPAVTREAETPLLAELRRTQEENAKLRESVQRAKDELQAQAQLKRIQEVCRIGGRCL